ncbi:hypothetical protein BS50DRAFT_362160 [Corynespora cassiicola Philippines]|uniref:F-box domain-containing protein n=1 Tax=Corynespora cassiicola Philippines TaxID=1448308 RepID=A0A2T2NSL5_CORCC|nr:hypothetical protein BS50DRAFT_362160 [Corynespora cassiicola Philippines]
MARFTDLPEDVLSLVFDQLSQRTVSELSRLCKPLREKAIPYLYQEIIFKAGKSRSCARRLSFLLRTLLERPQLTSHVRAFRLLGPHPNWTKFNPWEAELQQQTWTVNLWGLEGCTTLSKTQTIFASNQFYQLVDEEMHKSIAQFRGRSKDALAILVLTRFSRLTTLELGDGFLMYSLFLPQILKRADSLFPGLKHVMFGDVRPDPDNSVNYMDLDLIRPMFYSRSVEKFQVTMTQPWQFRWNRPEAPRSESLTMLHLFRTNINRFTLDQLLSAAPNLKRFHYDQEILFDHDSAGAPPLSPYLNLDGLNIALANLKNTLEDCKLTLRMAPGSLSAAEVLEAGLQFPPIQGTLTVLKEMQSLRKLDVPMVMFLGWAPEFAAKLDEVLPAGIQHLILRDDFIAYCPWALGNNCTKKVGRIGEYLGSRGTYAPQLETFKVRLTVARTDYWLLDAVKDLRTPIKRKSVRYWVVKERRKESHCWRFGSDEEDTRKDSVIPSGAFFLA